MPNDGYRHAWSRGLLQDFIDTFQSSSKDNYYFFIGKTDPWTIENVPDAAIDSVDYTNITWDDTIALKRLDRRNIVAVVPRFNWTSGTVYVQWKSNADHDKDGAEDAYYALVDNSRVYKCIESTGSGSTSKPTHTSYNTIQTADGYRWKFLYQLTERMKEFMTDEFLPVSFASDRLSDETINQSIAQSRAIDGAIESIDLVASNDYTFQKSETIEYPIRRDQAKGSLTVDLDISASSVDGDYVGYSFFVTDGRGPEIGTIRRITSYEGATRRATLSESLSENLYISNSSGVATKYKILPHVVVSGDGSGCHSVANVNSGYKVSSILVVNAGKDYRTASVRITTPNDTGSTPPNIMPLVSPKGGHGSNAVLELNASRAMILVHSSVDDITGNWPAENDFRQFGIVKNPVLNSTGITASTVVAGNEFDRITDLTILKPYGVDAIYTYDTTSGTYKVGQYVMGVESNAVGQIYDWKSNPNDLYATMTLKNIRGDFVVADPNKIEHRISFGDTGGFDFVPGTTVYQLDPVLGVTAEGIVESWATGDIFNELVVLGVTGSFIGTDGVTITNDDGIATTPASYSNILSFQPKGGELIKQYKDTGGPNGYVFESIDADLKQNYGRVIGSGETILASQERPTYRMTNILQVQSSFPHNPANYIESGLTISNNDTFAYSTANIFGHNLISGSSSGSTVDLYVNSVNGSFPPGTTLSLPIYDVTVVSNTKPEVVLGDGDIIYIQNIIPVGRTREQEEEFRILVGF